MFSALIEVNRKTKQSIKMSMGNKFGALCLFKSGELSFEPHSDFKSD